MNNMKYCKAQYKREKELEIVNQTQTPRYVLMFESLLYVPAFTQNDFHYIVHTGLPTRGTPLRIWVIQTGSTQLLSPTIQPLHKR